MRIYYGPRMEGKSIPCEPGLPLPLGPAPLGAPSTPSEALPGSSGYSRFRLGSRGQDSCYNNITQVVVEEPASRAPEPQAPPLGHTDHASRPRTRPPVPV